MSQNRLFVSSNAGANFGDLNSSPRECVVFRFFFRALYPIIYMGPYDGQSRMSRAADGLHSSHVDESVALAPRVGGERGKRAFAKRDLSICYPAIAPRGHFRESRLRARANRRRRRFRERRRSGHRHRARDRAERARARPPGPSRPQPTRTLVPRGDGGEEGDARAHAPPRWRTRSREGRRSARWERDVSSGARPRPGARRSRARAPRVRVSPRAPPPWRARAAPAGTSASAPRARGASRDAHEGARFDADRR